MAKLVNLLPVIQYAVVAVVAFVAGHKAQIAALIKGAEELGPEFAAVLAQIRGKAKGGPVVQSGDKGK